jgi:hypothetical protein
MDKFGNITFRYFIEGDYVITPSGYGIVLYDEKEIETEEDFRYSEILIQLKEGNSNNTSNSPIMIDRDCVSLTTKEKYDYDGIRLRRI